MGVNGISGSSKDWRPTAFVETTPGVVGDDEAEARRAEQRQAVIGVARHLTTLATVVLGLTVALVDRAFVAPLHRELVLVAVAALLLSVAAGGAACLVVVARTTRAGAPKSASGDRPDFVALALAFAGFLTGLASLAAFVLSNWLR